MELILQGSDLILEIDPGERKQVFEILGFPYTREHVLSNPLVHVHISYIRKKIYISEKYDLFVGRRVFRTRIFTENKDGRTVTYIPILSVRHQLFNGTNLDRMLPDNVIHERPIINHPWVVGLQIE